MKARQLVHGIAVLSLAIVAIMNIISAMRNAVASPLNASLVSVAAVGFWGFLVWKIWKRPRQWGLGIGIFLSCVLGFQIWAWCLALFGPHSDRLGMFANPLIFALNELPLPVAAFACFLLRLRYPDKPPVVPHSPIPEP